MYIYTYLYTCIHIYIYGIECSSWSAKAGGKDLSKTSEYPVGLGLKVSRSLSISCAETNTLIYIVSIYSHACTLQVGELLKKHVTLGVFNFIPPTPVLRTPHFGFNNGVSSAKHVVWSKESWATASRDGPWVSRPRWVWFWWLRVGWHPGLDATKCPKR